MFDPPETASNAAKAANELGLNPILNYCLMLLMFVVSIGAWLMGKRDRGKDYPEHHQDISEILRQHDTAKSVVEIERHMENATASLADIAKATDAANRGQEHTHRLLEEMLNNQTLGLDPITPPLPRPKERPRRHTDDALDHPKEGKG